jgi:hypothetical protein
MKLSISILSLRLSLRWLATTHHPIWYRQLIWWSFKIVNFIRKVIFLLVDESLVSIPKPLWGERAIVLVSIKALLRSRLLLKAHVAYLLTEHLSDLLDVLSYRLFVPVRELTLPTWGSKSSKLILLTRLSLSSSWAEFWNSFWHIAFVC